MDKDYNEYSKIAVRADSYQELKTIVTEQVAQSPYIVTNSLTVCKKTSRHFRWKCKCKNNRLFIK